MDRLAARAPQGMAGGAGPVPASLRVAPGGASIPARRPPLRTSADGGVRRRRDGSSPEAGARRNRRWAFTLAAALVLAGAASAALLPGSPGSSRPPTRAQTAGLGVNLDRIARLADSGVVTISALDAFSEDRLSATGIVVDRAGEVLTNNHAVEGATSIMVQLGGVGRSYPAIVVGTSPSRDIAVLTVAGAEGFQPLAMAGSDELHPGSSIVVVGNQGPGAPAASSGEVVGVGKRLAATDPVTEAPENLVGMIEMNVPVQPGDSGGPVLDASGQVVGMTTAGEEIADGLVPADAAYAIPIAVALGVAGQIEAGLDGPGLVLGAPAFLGVEAETYNQVVEAGPPPVLALLSDQQPQPASGALILRVVSGSPAAMAGMRAGDVIVRLAAARVNSLASLVTSLEDLHPGSHVEVCWVDPSGNSASAIVDLAAGPPV
jgi:S1-C subfamily serine protease